MIDIQKLYKDHNIPFWTSGPNVANGWVNIRCVMGCQDVSNHLGFSPQGNFACWKCGSHPLRKVLSRLLRISEDEVSSVIRQYGGRAHRRHFDDDETRIRIGTQKFQFPSNTDAMNHRHKQYLINRKFDPDKLEREWKLFGTGPISSLDGIDFKHRIVAPIYWNGKCVSFQARDFTNKSKLRYITCPGSRELVQHKSIIYGKQDEWQNSTIVTEGIFDVFRFGPKTVATFGIEYTIAQVYVISRRFKRVFVVFDSESQAQEQARRLVAELQFRNVDAIQITIENDPGSMDQDDADYLVKQLMK